MTEQTTDTQAENTNPTVGTPADNPAPAAEKKGPKRVTAAAKADDPEPPYISEATRLEMEAGAKAIASRRRR